MSNLITSRWWMALGFAGQALFASRFIVQWFCSEIKKESHIPMAFWYFSIGGGLILLVYAIGIKNPVFITGQAAGLVVYVRNLMLIDKKNKRDKAALNVDKI